MYQQKKVSLVFPAYNEEENIAQAIEDFQKNGLIDQIIVVDNNSKDKTAAIASKKGVKVVTEKQQGYGYALRRGMQEATGEYIFLCEPDGTFSANDVAVLLEYIDSCDMVTGTRTHTKYISDGANMKGFLRLGNKTVALFISLLYFRKNLLTDCGCTFRVMRKKLVRKILPQLTVGGSYFLAELLVCSLRSGFSVKEVPVHYKPRIGTSKITGSMKRSIIVGLQMLKTVVVHRFGNTSYF